jgi:ubiquinone/menaquinone biosynthesis C-methylase UbiE
MNGLTTRELYDRWAPGYAAGPHNPLMLAEQQVMLAHWPDLQGLDVLDLACGTGRYAALAQSAGARRVLALDFSAAMLAQARVAGRVRGDLGALPLRDAAFDVVISGLALGHAPDLERCVGEVRRVLRPGGTLLYSDFHPEASRRGLRRGFRDGAGERFELPVDGHSVAAHHAALRGAAFTHIEQFDIRAGIELRGGFPGDAQFLREWHGTPLALVVRARRGSA